MVRRVRWQAALLASRSWYAIKSAYDPANVFRSNHNVPPLPE